MFRRSLVVAILAATAIACTETAFAQPFRRGYVPPGPGIPPHLSDTRPITNLPAWPGRPGYPTYPTYPAGLQPWLNRGWVNSYGIVPGNVYVPSPLVVNVDNRPTNEPPPVVSGTSRTNPVRPQVLEFNKETGRFEDVSPGNRDPAPKIVSPPPRDDQEK